MVSVEHIKQMARSYIKENEMLYIYVAFGTGEEWITLKSGHVLYHHGESENWKINR